MSLADRDSSTADLAAIELPDGFSGLLVRAHLDERESTGSAGLSVRHHLGVGYCARLAEELAQLQLGRLV
jgi:hypothetical protein